MTTLFWLTFNTVAVTVAAIVGIGAPAAVSLPAAEKPAATGGVATTAGIVPTAEITQVLLAGKHGVPRDCEPVSMQVLGDYLYTEEDSGEIHYFRRDAKTGTLSYAGVVAAAKKDHYAGLYMAGGRLYAVRASCGDNQILWYDINAETGKPAERGSVDLMRKDGNGRIYAIDRRGRLFVVSTAGKKLDKVQLDAGVEATPAIVEGRIYIRTGNGLLCLGRQP